jgi:hypothetical protein
VDISVKHQNTRNIINVTFFATDLMHKITTTGYLQSQNLLLVSDGASISGAVSKGHCYQNICLKAVCQYKHKYIKFELGEFYGIIYICLVRSQQNPKINSDIRVFS